MGVAESPDEARSTLSPEAGGVELGIPFDLGSARPTFARTNNGNCLNCLHLEKIEIDDDRSCAFPCNCAPWDPTKEGICKSPIHLVFTKSE